MRLTSTTSLPSFRHANLQKLHCKSFFFATKESKLMSSMTWACDDNAKQFCIKKIPCNVTYSDTGVLVSVCLLPHGLYRMFQSASFAMVLFLALQLFETHMLLLRFTVWPSDGATQRKTLGSEDSPITERPFNCVLLLLNR